MGSSSSASVLNVCSSGVPSGCVAPLWNAPGVAIRIEDFGFGVACVASKKEGVSEREAWSVEGVEAEAGCGWLDSKEGRGGGGGGGGGLDGG